VNDVVHVRSRGSLPYSQALEEMRAFTRGRGAETADELWLVEHPPVYTVGQSVAPCDVGNGIPVVKSDRGGDITYHGPGQVVLYALVDLARRGIKVRRFVWLLEQAAIDVLGRGERRPGAPGVYVEGAKIAALGIRVVRGCAYHGLSLNVDMDLAPFAAIAPCGFPGLRVTQARDIGLTLSPPEMGRCLARALLARLAGHA